MFHDFGAASIGFTKGDFLNGAIIKQIGQPPLRIDILSEIDGVSYTDALKDKQYFKSQELSIPFIGVTDFIKNKQASGRKKDIEDINKIQKTPQKPAKKTRKKKT